MNRYPGGIRLLAACCFLSAVPAGQAQVMQKRAIFIPTSPEKDVMVGPESVAAEIIAA